MTLKKVIKRKLNIRENISSIFRENIFYQNLFMLRLNVKLSRIHFPKNSINKKKKRSYKQNERIMISGCYLVSIKIVRDNKMDQPISF
jgi:hypothetical protein